MTPHVALADLDESTLDDLLTAAVDGAELAEVMGPLPGERGWTTAQRAGFRAFHRRHSSVRTITARPGGLMLDTAPGGGD